MKIKQHSRALGMHEILLGGLILTATSTQVWAQQTDSPQPDAEVLPPSKIDPLSRLMPIQN